MKEKPKATTLEYETKCRRCNGLHRWFFGTTETISYDDFRCAMDSKLEAPRLMYCKHRGCKQDTIQDLVSYSPSKRPS